MKKLSISLAIVALFVLAVGNTNAQNSKEVESSSAHWEGYVPCTDDYLVGTETYTTTTWDKNSESPWWNKKQFIFKGEYIGYPSEKSYTWSLVQNIKYKEWVGKTAVSGNIATAVIECEGEPIAILKLRAHFTSNANGETVVQRVEYMDWQCY